MNIDAKTVNKMETEYSNTSKRSYTTINWNIFPECKVGVTFINQ